MTATELATTLEAIGWGATALAARTGYSRQGVQQWLIGRVRVPDEVAAWLRALAALYSDLPAPQRSV